VIARALKGILALYLLLLCSSGALAQNRYDLHQFARESLDFIKQPARWRSNDWIELGLIGGGTALTMQIDEPVRRAVLKDHGRYFHSAPIVIGRMWGEWYTPLILAGGIGLQGWRADDVSSKKIAFEILQSVLYAESITQALKIAFGRARPYENDGAFSFRPMVLSSGVGFHSLPGGHNTNGWAISTVLSRNARSTPLKILAYAPAALTFLSRVYQDQHWTSDDFLGAAIGLVVGRWVGNLHEQRESGARVMAVAPFTISISF
jgi:membrane-associated phospholipid phosphatase